MSNPRDFPKSVSVLYSISTSLYIASAVVIYCYGGSHIESPALGSAGPLMKKVVYGLALPTVCHLTYLYDTHLSLIYVTDYCLWGCGRPCRMQNRLCAHFPRLRSYPWEQSHVAWGIGMGDHCIGYMDNFLGNCHVNSCVQQPIKSYRMFPSLSCLVFVLSISLTSLIYTYRLLFSEAGLAVSRKSNYPLCTY